MSRKSYPSGMMPADTAPATNQKPSKSPDNLVDRLDAMVGNVRTSPINQLRAALYLRRFEDGRDLSEYLGVTDAFDGIARIRAREAAEAATA